MVEEKVNEMNDFQVHNEEDVQVQEEKSEVLNVEEQVVQNQPDFEISGDENNGENQ